MTCSVRSQYSFAHLGRHRPGLHRASDGNPCPPRPHCSACLRRVTRTAVGRNRVAAGGSLSASADTPPVAQRRAGQKRQTRRMLVLLGAVLLATLAYLATCLPVLPGAATAATASGAVFRRPSGSARWRSLAPGDRLAEGDSVRIADGALSLVLPGGSRLELQPGAELRIAVLRTGLAQESCRALLEQRGGRVAYRVSRSRGWGSSFLIHSASASISLCGESTALVAQQGEATQVTLFGGCAQVGGAGQGLMLGPREVAIVDEDGTVARAMTLTATAYPEVSGAATPDTDAD